MVSWLLSINNVKVKDWTKYDDPMTTSQNILIELRNLGLELPISPNKLKAGCGEEVCQLLLALTQVSLNNKFKFKKAQIKDDGHGMDDDADDVDEMDGGADLADVIHEIESDEDIDEDFDMGGGNIQAELAKQMEAEMQQNAII